MNTKLMRAEMRLALVPPAVLFQLSALMILIPVYPFLVIFFYGLLGIFFVCVFGRENRNLEYMALLPVTRASIVRARFTLSIGIELALTVLTSLLALVRPALGLYGNEAGMNPGAGFFGTGLALMGLFNIVFFPMYYKNTNKIGVPFTIAALVYAAGMVVAEGTAIMNPALAADEAAGLWVLTGGAVLYALLTWAAYRVSVRRFQKMNLVG